MILFLTEPRERTFLVFVDVSCGCLDVVCRWTSRGPTRVLEVGGERGVGILDEGRTEHVFTCWDVFMPFAIALSMFVCVSFVFGVLFDVKVSEVISCCVYEK